MTPLDDARCDLGEGAFWHPERRAFFWFDITLGRMHGVNRNWQFDEMVSAMGWVDQSRVLIASQTQLFLFDLDTGARATLCALEADNAVTRSNDGRADPQGGFWIGTMGTRAEPGAGAIWRWYRGALRRLYAGVTIPNAISFPPDGRSACFADTVTRQVLRVALDPEGWPVGTPECWLDLSVAGLNPDGAVFDAEGRFWVAQWGASRVAAYAPDGGFVRAIAVPARHVSCPAFGGETLADLHVTSARQGLALPGPRDGAAFCARGIGRGLAEHRILLPSGAGA